MLHATFDPAPPVRTIVRWLDHHNGHSTPELSLRLLKLSEEYGEFLAAWIDFLDAGTPARRDRVIDELTDVVQTAWIALGSLGEIPTLGDLYVLPDADQSGDRLALRLGAAVGRVADAWIGYRGQNPRKGRCRDISDVQHEIRGVLTLSRLALVAIGSIPAITLIRQSFAQVIQRSDGMQLPTDVTRTTSTADTSART